MSGSIDSGVKIFLILDILFESPKNIEEICKKLSRQGIKADKKTVSKYLRTIKQFGFQTEKRNGKFHVLSSPFESKENFEGAEIIFCIIEHFFKNNIEYEPFKTKFENMFNLKINRKTHELIKEKFKISENITKNIQTVNNLIKQDKKEVNVLYKGKKLKLSIKEIKFAKNGIFLCAKNKTERTISCLKLEYIEIIKPDKTKISKFKPENGINFKIKNTLRKNYILKKGEVAHHFKDETIITNSYEEKEEIFSRLLKYGKNAEIVSPKKERDLFQKKVKELIEHYNSM